MNDHHPLVSVCVQTYNHKDFIQQCLDGILMQETTFPFEIILGEDESNDGTREICIDYAKRHPNKIRLFLRSRKDVIFINDQATGRYNFIENLKASKGKYIALCEGDDYWTDPLKLQKQVDFLKNNSDYSICFHRAQLLTKKGFSLHEIPDISNNGDYCFIDLLEHYNFITTASIVFKLPQDFRIPSWFEKLPFGDLGLYSLVSNNKKIKGFEDNMSVYRIHDKGIYQRFNNYEKDRMYLQFYKVIFNHLGEEEKKIVRQKNKELKIKLNEVKFKDNSLKRFIHKLYLHLKY